MQVVTECCLPTQRAKSRHGSHSVITHVHLKCLHIISSLPPSLPRQVWGLGLAARPPYAPENPMAWYIPATSREATAKAWGCLGTQLALAAEDKSVQNRGLGPRLQTHTPQPVPHGTWSADLAPVPPRQECALSGPGLFLAECSEDNPCEGLSRHATFTNFGMAFLTLFRVSTGDNWNGIMKVMAGLPLPPLFLAPTGGGRGGGDRGEGDGGGGDGAATHPAARPRTRSGNAPVRTSTASATCPPSRPSTSSPSCWLPSLCWSTWWWPCS